jgi:hypothetical protein
VYDLTERVIPAPILAAATPARDDARRELLMRSAAALGVGTAKDFVSYFLLGLGVAGVSERTVYPKTTTAGRLVAELAGDGRLVPVRVQGWEQPAYRHPAARAEGSTVDDGALLSPFDSLIWERERTERLFGFRYRSEIYTPPAKRQYGYYVLPFLLGDTLVARVDLKADRQAGVLRVLGAYGSADPGPLAARLRDLATWLGLAEIEVTDRGDLAGPLLASREWAFQARC